MSEKPDYAEDELRWSRAMRDAQRGDRSVYAGLLEELGEVIEAYVRGRFGDLDILEDCVQECLLSIHQARHTYDPALPFRPWLFTLVRHRAIDLLRNRSSRLAQESGAPSQSEPSSDRMHENLHLIVDVVRILTRLAPEQRQAVALVKYLGFSTAEAACRVGLSEAALKSRLHRGLESIRRSLEGEGFP